MVLLTKQELQACTVLDPEIDAILNSGQFTLPDVDFSDSVIAVNQLRAITEHHYGGVTEVPGVDNIESTYETRDNTTLRLLVFKPNPTASTKLLPVMVFFHGGYGGMGSPENSSSYCQQIALTQDCIVVSPQYRLAPEYKFPTGIQDCSDALKHIANNGSDFGGDLKLGFVIGGHSNGASVSAILALEARDRNLQPPITGLYFAAGSFVSPDHVPEEYRTWQISHTDEACCNSPILGKQVVQVFDEVLGAEHTSPWYRAMAWPTGHGGMPKTYLQICGQDMARDQSFIYQDVLEKGGAKTRVDIYPGCPHVFWTVFSMVNQGKKWSEDTKKGLAWLFDNSNIDVSKD